MPTAMAAWRRDIAAGVSGTLTSLPNVLTQGLLAYALLAAAGPSIGIPAAFVSVVIGGSVFAALGRGPMPAAGPSSAGVLILAGLVSQVLADPAFDIADPGMLAALLAVGAGRIVTTK